MDNQTISALTESIKKDCGKDESMAAEAALNAVDQLLDEIAGDFAQVGFRSPLGTIKRIHHECAQGIKSLQTERQRQETIAEAKARFEESGITSGCPVRYSILNRWSQSAPARVSFGFFVETSDAGATIDTTEMDWKGKPRLISVGWDRVASLEATSFPFPVEALTTRAELYERAQEADLPGRSKMKLEELRTALSKLEQAGQTPAAPQPVEELIL